MTTFVLLRGLAREARHWGDVPERLRQQLGPCHSVVPLDLPGNGEFSTQASPASVAGMAAACRRTLAQRGIDGPVVLVAMSLGALVALHWCQDAPQEVARCVLVNTSLRGVSPFWQRLRPGNSLRLIALLTPGRTLLERESAVLAMTSSRPQRHPEVAQRWADIAASCPVSRGNALRQLLAAMRYGPASTRPKVPILVLASAGDALVHPDCSRSLARRWQLPLEIHPSAGHDLPLDDPDWFVRRVERWWTQRPASSNCHRTATSGSSAAATVGPSP